MSQANEETPLLQNNHELVYERFSPQKKKVLVAIVSWSGLVAFFTAGTFVPSIPQIAKDLGSSGEVISHAVSISILGGCVGGLVGSSYSKFYGRRPAYLWCLPMMIMGSFAVARSRTVPQLMAWRFVQAMGGSPGLSVGAGVIGDIYKLEERGAALGSYFGTGLLGLALAPTIGGFIAHYWSWQGIHYLLALFAFGALFCILLFFPETSHPGSMGFDEYKRAGKVHPKWRPLVLNPVSQLGYLRSPNVLVASLVGSFALLTDFSGSRLDAPVYEILNFVLLQALLLPFPYTIGKRYGIENEAIIGLCFLPLGIGNAAGSPLAGWISDKIVIKYRAKRGKWYPEDRLRACLFGFFLPITVIASALITKYVPGPVGLALNLVCLFMNGVGVDIALTPCGAYIVDILHSHSAEATAAVNALRSLTLSASTAMLLPSINAHGHLTTNFVVSLFALVGLGLAWLTITYGEPMRAWRDVGFSTVDDS